MVHLDQRTGCESRFDFFVVVGQHLVGEPPELFQFVISDIVPGTSATFITPSATIFKQLTTLPVQRCRAPLHLLRFRLA
jgi:hypothetical protein